MQQLLAIEWLKIRRYTTFWVIILLCIGLQSVWDIGVHTGMISLGNGALNLLGQSSSFAGIWSSLCYYASYFVLFPAIFMIINITNEYQFRTNRQNIIDGWTRLQFYHVKWGLLLGLSFALTLFIIVLGVLIGLIKGADFSSFGDNFSKVGYLFVLTVNYFGFSLLLSALFKRSGLTIGMLLLYVMVIEIILHLYFFFGLKISELDWFLPLQCSDELLPNPSIDALIKAGKFHAPAAYTYVIASCCWIIIYYFLGKRRLLRSDW